MDLKLTIGQVQELSDLLEQALRDLSHEIAATENPRYRFRLKARRNLLREVAEALRQPVGNPVPQQLVALDREMAHPGG